MSLIRKHGAVLQAWACLDLVVLNECCVENIKRKVATKDKEQRYYEKNGHRHQHHAEND